MAEGAGEKTEKATPKKKEDARKKGQVGKSMDFNGAVVVLSALGVLMAAGPFMWGKMAETTRLVLVLVASPEVVDREGIGGILSMALGNTALALAPVAGVCLVAGLASSIMQVGFKPAPEAIKPDAKKLNPINGAKMIFGKHALFELGKNLTKVSAVGGIAALAVLPQLEDFAALVGMPPAELGPHLVDLVKGVCLRAAAAYFVIACVDLGYQKWKFEKDLRMDKQEVKDEMKQQSTPAEVKAAQRRRQMQAAQRRMMDAIPTADVVVTNPTHFAVALKYEPSEPAPRVVAKGVDHVALKIREKATAAGVPIIEDRPLARSLHAGVEIGHFVPEELFAAVAAVLAWVYRTAGMRRSSRAQQTPITRDVALPSRSRA
jgi:flagellar biosynthetic protein FlhB